MLQPFIEAINTKLAAKGVATAIGAKHLAANGTPPRVVWVPKRREGEPPMTSSQNPRTLETSKWQVEAHCWGADLLQAERLEQAVISDGRRVGQGAALQHMYTEPLPIESAYTNDGYVLVVTLRLLMPLPEGAESALSDNTIQTVVITSWGIDPPATNVTGDGALSLEDPPHTQEL